MLSLEILSPLDPKIYILSGQIRAMAQEAIKWRDDAKQIDGLALTKFDFVMFRFKERRERQDVQEGLQGTVVEWYKEEKGTFNVTRVGGSAFKNFGKEISLFPTQTTSLLSPSPITVEELVQDILSTIEVGEQQLITSIALNVMLFDIKEKCIGRKEWSIEKIANLSIYDSYLNYIDKSIDKFLNNFEDFQDREIQSFCIGVRIISQEDGNLVTKVFKSETFRPKEVAVSPIIVENQEAYSSLGDIVEIFQRQYQKVNGYFQVVEKCKEIAKAHLQNNGSEKYIEHLTIFAMTGENLFDIEPKILKYNFTDISCKTCHKWKTTSHKLYKCSKCFMAYYCDRECQLKDWKMHKVTCLPTLRQSTEESDE